MSKTNLKSVLDDMFEKTESELCGNIAWADVDQKLALVDFFKELQTAKDLIVKKYETTCERNCTVPWSWEKFTCLLQKKYSTGRKLFNDGWVKC